MANAAKSKGFRLKPDQSQQPPPPQEQLSCGTYDKGLPPILPQNAVVKTSPKKSKASSSPAPPRPQITTTTSSSGSSDHGSMRTSTKNPRSSYHNHPLHSHNSPQKMAPITPNSGRGSPKKRGKESKRKSKAKYMLYITNKGLRIQSPRQAAHNEYSNVLIDSQFDGKSKSDRKSMSRKFAESPLDKSTSPEKSSPGKSSPAWSRASQKAQRYDALGVNNQQPKNHAEEVREVSKDKKTENIYSNPLKKRLENASKPEQETETSAKQPAPTPQDQLKKWMMKRQQAKTGAVEGSPSRNAQETIGSMYDQLSTVQQFADTRRMRMSAQDELPSMAQQFRFGDTGSSKPESRSSWNQRLSMSEAPVPQDFGLDFSSGSGGGGGMQNQSNYYRPQTPNADFRYAESLPFQHPKYSRTSSGEGLPSRDMGVPMFAEHPNQHSRLQSRSPSHFDTGKFFNASPSRPQSTSRSQLPEPYDETSAMGSPHIHQKQMFKPMPDQDSNFMSQRPSGFQDYQHKWTHAADFQAHWQPQPFVPSQTFRQPMSPANNQASTRSFESTISTVTPHLDLQSIKMQNATPYQEMLQQLATRRQSVPNPMPTFQQRSVTPNPYCDFQSPSSTKPLQFDFQPQTIPKPPLHESMAKSAMHDFHPYHEPEPSIRDYKPLHSPVQSTTPTSFQPRIFQPNSFRDVQMKHVRPQSHFTPQNLASMQAPNRNYLGPGNRVERAHDDGNTGVQWIKLDTPPPDLHEGSSDPTTTFYTGTADTDRDRIDTQANYATDNRNYASKKNPLLTFKQDTSLSFKPETLGLSFSPKTQSKFMNWSSDFPSELPGSPAGKIPHHGDHSVIKPSESVGEQTHKKISASANASKSEASQKPPQAEPESQVPVLRNSPNKPLFNINMSVLRQKEENLNQILQKKTQEYEKKRYGSEILSLMPGPARSSAFYNTKPYQPRTSDPSTYRTTPASADFSKTDEYAKPNKNEVMPSPVTMGVTPHVPSEMNFDRNRPSTLTDTEPQLDTPAAGRFSPHLFESSVSTPGALMDYRPKFDMSSMNPTKIFTRTNPDLSAATANFVSSVKELGATSKQFQCGSNSMSCALRDSFNFKWPAANVETPGVEPSSAPMSFQVPSEPPRKNISDTSTRFDRPSMGDKGSSSVSDVPYSTPGVLQHRILDREISASLAAGGTTPSEFWEQYLKQKTTTYGMPSGATGMSQLGRSFK